MGRHVEAHIQRYIDGRMDFLEFEGCFLGEVLEDAIATRTARYNNEVLIASILKLGGAWIAEPAPPEDWPAISTEEMLSALEPTKTKEQATPHRLTLPSLSPRMFPAHHRKNPGWWPLWLYVGLAVSTLLLLFFFVMLHIH